MGREGLRAGHYPGAGVGATPSITMQDTPPPSLGDQRGSRTVLVGRPDFWSLSLKALVGLWKGQAGWPISPFHFLIFKDLCSGREFTFENSWIVFKCPTAPSVREQGSSETGSIPSGHVAHPWQSRAANTASRVLAACTLSRFPAPSETAGRPGRASGCSPPTPPPPYAFPGRVWTALLVLLSTLGLASMCLSGHSCW